MQRPDEAKRRQIAAVAARLFASEPFHKVKLDDIAAAAGVGKGTLYVYFPSKEELYFSLVYDGFSQLVDRLRAQLGDGVLPPRESFRMIVAELFRFAFGHPHFFELMRTVDMRAPRSKPWMEKRGELTALIEGTIRRGIRMGVFQDRHPELTALCIPGLVRSVMLFGPREIDEKTVVAHMTCFVENGIVAPSKERPPVRSGRMMRNGARRKPR